MSNELKTVAVRLDAITDLYNAKMAQSAGVTASAASSIEGSMRRAGTTMSQTGTDMTRKLTPAALAMAAAFGLAFHQFQGGQDALRAETGATGKQLDELTTSMRNVGSEVPQSLEKVGQVMGIIHDRTGLTGPPLEKLTKQLLELEHLGQALDADTATRMFSDWNIATDKESDALDTLYKTSQLTGTGVSTLATDVVKFGAPLRAFGYDFQTSTLLLGNFEKEGVNTGAVMMGMRVALARFSKEGLDARPALEGVISRIRALGPGAASANLAFETFGRRGGADMLRAILEGKVGVDELTRSLAANTDTIDAGAQATFHFTDRLAMWKNDVVGALGPMSQWAMVGAGMVVVAGPLVRGFGGLIVVASGAGDALAGMATMAIAAQAGFYELVVADGVLSASLGVLDGIMTSTLVTAGLMTAGIGLGIAEIVKLNNLKSADVSKIDFTDFAAASAGINAYGKAVDALGDRWNKMSAAEHLSHPDVWRQHSDDAAQYEELLKHISAIQMADFNIADKLGIPQGQGIVAQMMKDLQVDPTQVAWSTLQPVLEKYRAGTIDAAEAQKELDVATDGATKAARLQSAADQQAESENQQLATSARGVYDAQTKVRDSLRAVEDAKQKYNDVSRQGIDLARSERSAQLDLVSAEQALQDEKEKIAGLPREGAQADLDLKDAKLGVLDAQANLAKVNADSASTDLDKAHAQLQLEQANLRVEDATQRVSDVQKDASRSGTDLARAQLGVQDAEAKVRDAHDAVAKHAHDVQRAEEDLQTAYTNSAMSAIDLAAAEAALENQGALTAGQTAAVQIPILEQLASTMDPANPLRANLQAYIDSLKLIPGAVPTTVTLDTSAAEKAYLDFVGWMNAAMGNPAGTGIGVWKPPSNANVMGPVANRDGAAGGGGRPAGWMGNVNELGPELLTVGGKTMLMLGAQQGTITPHDQVGAAIAGWGRAHTQQSGGRGDVNIAHLEVNGNEPAPTARSVIMEMRKAAVLRRIF